MSRVAIFDVFGHFYTFDRKFDKGHSYLTKKIYTVSRFDHSLLIFMGYIL